MVSIKIKFKLKYPKYYPQIMIILLINYITTLIMTGAIWLAQLSQYPLLAHIGRENFIQYEQEHIRRISTIAWLFIYIEALTSLLLVFTPIPNVAIAFKWYGLVLITIIWSATWFIQYPIHKKLSHGFDKKLHQTLVNTNWIRTIGWTLRSTLLTYIFFSLLV